MNDEILDKLPLIRTIKDYLEEDIAPFSMPGGKYSKAFYEAGISDLFLKGDITEFDGVDNLHKPEGVIKESQDKLSKLYKSKASYFLVNGSTCGNMIMIFATFSEGDKVIVERNCHRSIMNAIIIRKLVPVFVKNIIHEEFKAPVAVDIEDLKKVIENNKDAKGIILTYPYYYGLGIGVKNVIKTCKDNNLKILIDSAHGAHFGFNKKLPVSAQDLGADIVIMSAHKTLPSFTQTAYMHINNEELIESVEFYKGIFLSTSPSYIFMMSLEYSRYFLEYNAQKEYDNLIKKIDMLKHNIKNLNYVKIIDSEFFENFNEDIELDNSRIVLHVEKGLSGHKLLEYLRNNKVQAEMSDERNVILIPSPFNTDNDFKKLENALKKCDYTALEEEEKGFYDIDIPEMVLVPSEVLESKRVWININECENKISGDTIIAYPPGVPLLVMGEKIEKRHIELMKKYIFDNVTLMGTKDSNIFVVDK
ncbi:MAG: aminotransferase class I/II-fold pyridoxal phosphate-dependent enzyme [Sarcina sp.]